MLPKTEWLEAFAAFGEELNFTRAAERLHISQPALHSQIRRLSEELEVVLYRRRGRGLTLTPAGEQALRFARTTLRQSESFLEQIRGEHPSGPVVLAAGEGAFLYLLGAAIRAYVSTKARLQLLTYPGPPVLQKVLHGDAHLGVIAGLEAPEDLGSWPLAQVRHVGVVPVGHRLARRRRISVAELAQEPLIVPPPGSRLRESVASFAATEGCELRIAVEASGWESMLHFARLGLGPTVVNGCCRLPRGLIGIPLRDLPAVRYQVVHAQGAEEDPRVKGLMALLKRHKDDWKAAKRVAFAAS